MDVQERWLTLPIIWIIIGQLPIIVFFYQNELDSQLHPYHRKFIPKRKSSGVCTLTTELIFEVKIMISRFLLSHSAMSWVLIPDFFSTAQILSETSAYKRFMRETLSYTKVTAPATSRKEELYIITNKLHGNISQCRKFTLLWCYNTICTLTLYVQYL